MAAVAPWAFMPPSMVADCGVSPRWPMTGMPAPTIAETRATIGPAPSSLTASAPALTRRTAFATASSSDAWKEPNGMSPMTSARGLARATAPVSITASSMLTGTVVS